MFQARDVPSVLTLDCETHRLIALFNWSEQETTMRAEVPEGSWHAFEFWSREYLGLSEGSVSVSLPAHGCALVRLTRDAGRPTVVGSTLHITQGAMEIGGEEWDGERLRIQLRPVANGDGEIFVSHTDGVRTIQVTGLREGRTVEL
jgi:hypothetical protein